MAGAYGEINSRVGFRRVLREATGFWAPGLGAPPDDPIMKQILKELDAMKRWSENGRTPTEGERKRINVGLIAARELSETTGEVNKFAEKLSSLNNYFEDWPTDEQAASDTDDDDDDDNE